MSFTPSIGDVLAAIGFVIDVYGKVQDAPSEIDAAIKDVKGMKAELESMRDKVGDEKYFVKKNGDAMLATIMETFEPLKEDLQNMKRLIREYSRIPPFSGQKIIYAMFKIPDVKKIQESFNKYRAVYSRAFEHAGAVHDAQNAAELKAINSKLEAKNKQLAADFAVLKKQQQQAAKVQKENSAKVDQVLKLLEKMAIPAAPSGPSKGLSTLEWENELVANGLKRDEAKKIMGLTSQNAQQGTPSIKVDLPSNKVQGQLHKNKSQSALNMSGGLNPLEKLPARARSVSQPRDKNAPRQPSPSPSGDRKKSPSPNPENRKPPSSNPRKPGSKNTEHIWILCVDRTNGCKQSNKPVHSILAQTYLELLRLWTANCTPAPAPPRWLFSRVDSCGLNISTPLTTSPSLSPPIPTYTQADGPTAPETPITALTAPDDYFWSKDYPHEKENLVRRMKARALKSRGIDATHLENYHYVLCFDRAVEGDLKRLEESLRGRDRRIGKANGNKVISKILCLDGLSWFHSDKHTHEKEIQEVIGNMRVAIKGFVARELGWERPTRMFQNGPCRTLQLVLPWKIRPLLLERIGRTARGRLEVVKEMEGVWAMITWEGGKGGVQLVSLTGPREKLKAAEGWMKGLC